MSGSLTKVIVSICLALMIVLGVPQNALASSCSGWWKGESELAENLKKIIVGNVSVPVQSTDLSGVADFKKLLISVNTATSATVESGSVANLSDLKDATGHASVQFQVHGNLNKVPLIKSYLDSQYPSVVDAIRVSNVNAVLVFLASDGTRIATHPFKLEEGKNEVTICEFGKFKKDVSNIDINIKSFDGSFNVSHSF